MLSSELVPDHDSLALIKKVLHGEGNAEEKLQHLREVLSDNVIVTGWINDPRDDNSAEGLISHLRERVEKFTSNQHLRDLETIAAEEAEAKALAQAEAEAAAKASEKTLSSQNPQV